MAQGTPSFPSVPYQYSKKQPEGFLRLQGSFYRDDFCSQALTSLSS